MNLNMFNKLIIEYNKLKKDQQGFWDRWRLRRVRKQIYKLIVSGANEYAAKAYKWSYETFESMFKASAGEKEKIN